MTQQSLRNRKKNTFPQETVEPGKPVGTPSDIFLRMTQKGPPGEVVEFEPTKGEKYQIRINVLSYLDQEMCKVRALEHCKEIGIEVVQPYSQNEIYSDAVACEVLCKAICDPELVIVEGSGTQFYRQIFADTQALRSALTPDQIVQLFNYYSLVQAMFGLNDYTIMVQENFEEWVDSIAEGADKFPLARLPLPVVDIILREMAMEIRSLWDFQLSHSENGSESVPETLNTENTSSIADVSNGTNQDTPTQTVKKAMKKRSSDSSKAKS